MVSGLPLSWLHWFRQKPGRGLEWIGRIDGGTGTIFAQSLQGQFSITKDTNKNMVYLEIKSLKTEETSQVTYVTMVPRVGNETLRPLGVATGNALSVTRSEDTYEKTPPVGRRQPMTSLPAYHNISAAGRIHHQLLRLKLASEAWLKAQGTQCLVPHSGNHGYIRNLRRSPSWELELRPLGVATGNVIPTSPC